MAKKQQNRTDEYRLYAMLNQQLGEAFEQYLREARPKPSKKAILTKWIEDALTELGYWPPGTPRAGEKLAEEMDLTGITPEQIEAELAPGTDSRKQAEAVHDEMLRDHEEDS
jgi:hypothetical protein